MVGRYAAALVDSEGPRGGLGRGYDNVLTPCSTSPYLHSVTGAGVNFAGDQGQLRRVALRHSSKDPSTSDAEGEESGYHSLLARVPDAGQLAERRARVE